MEFFQNGITMVQSAQQFRLSTDAMVLADFSKNAPRICDLCAGAGAVGLLLCAAFPDCRVTALELQHDAVALLQQNITANALGARLTALEGDIRDIRTLLPANSFDAVVCNPPYFPVGAGALPQEPAFAIARTELCCSLTDVCAAAAWLLQSGGSFYLVHRPERLTDLIVALRQHRLEPKRLRFVRHRADAPVSLVLIESVSGARPGLQYQTDLILSEADGSPTEAYRRIYHTQEGIL